MSNSKEELRSILSKGDGILNLIPAWTTSASNKPGKRLRMHPDDLYAMGMERGAITERRLSSLVEVATPGHNEHEGQSYVNVDGNKEHAILFQEFVDELGEELIGKKLMEEYGTWPMHGKLYDFNEPLYHHVHFSPEASEKIGEVPKHEHYFFPKQYNNHMGLRPTTFFGFDPSVSKEQVMECIKGFGKHDTHILALSRAFQLELGTGWFTPAGVVHAPGSLCTYEPQLNSNNYAVWENVFGTGEVVPKGELERSLPEGDEDVYDKIMDTIDWDLNVAQDYRERFYRPPFLDKKDTGYVQNWICYGNDYVAAKELTVEPGAEVIIKDNAAYGCIVVQGHGMFGNYKCESPTLIRYGQLTADEFFVSNQRATEGVRIVNGSDVEPLVILKHFASDVGIPSK